MTLTAERPVVTPPPDDVNPPTDASGSGGARRRRPTVPDWVRPGQPGPPLSRGGVVTVWVVSTISLAAMFFLVAATWFSGFQHHRSNSLLYAQLRDAISQGVTPTGGAVAPGTPLAVLSIPAIGLSDQVVVEGSDSQQTSRAIGHRRDTVLPGQFGVSLLYGRTTTYGGVFSRIADLRPGQTIRITTAQGSFTYQVERARHAGDPLPAALGADGSRVTLTTASGSPFDTTGVVSVDAKIVGKPVQGPTGRPAAVADAEKALGTNTNSLVLLVFWLQGFVLSAVLATWAGFRWGGWQTWMAAAPVLVGTLWEATQQVLLLLPNLF